MPGNPALSSPPSRQRPWQTLAGFILLLMVMTMVWRGSRRQPEISLDPVTAPWTTASAREERRREIINNSINRNLDLPTTPDHDGRWQDFLEAVKWQDDRRPEVLAVLRRRLQLPPAPASAGSLTADVARLTLETAFGLFPQGLEPEMKQIFRMDHDARRLAMAGAWLVRHDPGEAHRHQLMKELASRFPDWESEPRLLALGTELQDPRAAAIRRRPPLDDLLKAPFDGRPVVFSFQRLDRRFTGRAVVRHASGGFLLESDGTPFSVSQFALSASGLPGTLTNGNTPCGIFEIVRISRTKSRSIGPTPTLVLGLPLEYDRSWTEARYRSLLPSSWQRWWPVQEAWWAGQAGRYEILAHGTAIDPAPWQQTVFAGQTPSHGCLTCREEWDPLSGLRTGSEQARLAEAFGRAGGAPGYLVVVELDDQQVPVSAEEVARLLKNSPLRPAAARSFP